MSLLEEVYPAPVKERLVVFVIDTNEKIDGYTMGITKILLEDSVRTINQIMSNCYDDVRIKLAVLQYGGCSWVTSENEPINVEEFFLSDYSEHDMKGLGQALSELNQKLDRKGFMKTGVVWHPPIIIFIGSGHTNENLDKEIYELKNNNWYKHSIKIGVMTDIQSNTTLFERLTGNVEAVFNITEMKTLHTLLNRIFFDYTS